MLTAVFPGVDIAPAFGQSIYLSTHDAASTDGWDLNAWVPPSLTMSPEDRKALAMTSPGLGLDGWHDVWWRGSGHFDDPASAACRPDDEPSTIDGVPIVRTPAEAVELCRNEFVIDRLVWLSAPPTDTATIQRPSRPGVPVMPFPGALAVLAFVAVLAWPRRSNRAG